jgi:hypothetical protein
MKHSKITERLVDYIQFITWYASQREEHLTAIRLVKFLYLLDLYYARENKGEIITGCSWRFVHYGPFCIEAMEAIKYATKEDLITAIPFKSKYDDEEHYLYSFPFEEEPPVGKKLSIYVRSALENAIKKWADDTPGLLDHVYFETEPMLDVRKGDLLDFSLARIPEKTKPIQMTRIPKEQLETARKSISNLAHKYALGIKEFSKIRSKIIIDQDYNEAIKYLNEYDLDIGLSGIVEHRAIKFDTE